MQLNILFIIILNKADSWLSSTYTNIILLLVQYTSKAVAR